MQEQLTTRLEELRKEYVSGQKMLVDLESQAAALRDTMLRISGAIQVLEEMLQSPPANLDRSDICGAAPANPGAPKLDQPAPH